MLLWAYSTLAAEHSRQVRAVHYLYLKLLLNGKIQEPVDCIVLLIGGRHPRSGLHLEGCLAVRARVGMSSIADTGTSNESRNAPRVSSRLGLRTPWIVQCLASQLQGS
jgi:hypothetical protein